MLVLFLAHWKNVGVGGAREGQLVLIMLEAMM